MVRQWNFDCSSSSKLALLKLDTVDPCPLVVMLVDAEIGESSRHYPARRSAMDEGVLRKVLDSEMLAEEVLVEVEKSVDG